MTWIKFKDQMPPEPISKISTAIPVLIGINTEIDGILVDLIYWEQWGKTWKLNYGNSFIYDRYDYKLEDLSWLPYPFPDIEIEEEAQNE